MEDPFRRPVMGSALFYKNAFDALDWLEKAFGFERTMVITDKEGNLGHSEMRFEPGETLLQPRQTRGGSGHGLGVGRGHFRG